MEDREALKRQIELLQNLINTHRSVHGDAPSHVGERRPLVPAPSRGRGLAAQTSASFRAPPRPYGPAPAGHWRKKYSLRNKSPASTAPASSNHTAPSAQGSLSNKSPASTAPAPSNHTAPSSLGSLSNKSPASTAPAPSNHTAPSAQGSRGNKSPASTAPAPSNHTALSSLGSLSNRSPASTTPAPSNRSAPSPLGSLSNRSPASTTPAPSNRTAPPSLGHLPRASCSAVGAGSRPGSSPAPGMRRAEQGGKGADACPGPAGGVGARGGLAATAGGPASAPRKRGLGATGDQEGGGASGLPAGQALGPRRKSPGPPVEAGSALQLKPRLLGRVHSAPKLAATPAVPRSTPLPPPPPPSAHSSALPRTVVIPGSKGGVAKQRLLPSRAKSQFTWVKGSQGLAPNSAPSPGGACAMPLPTPARRTLRRPVSVAKTTKYTWVSSSSSSSMRLSRKPLSPKALDTPQRAAFGGGARKLKSAASHAAKHKKGAGQGAGPAGSSQAHSSRYRWKAMAQNRTGVARGGSVYRWTSEKENGPEGGGGPGPPSSEAERTPVSVATAPPAPSPGGFKLRSRMKIIRRKSFSSVAAVGADCRSGAEYRSGAGVLTVTSRYALRRRASTGGRGLGCGRKAPGRGLVCFGRHKLRRLAPAPGPAPTPAGFRTGSSSSPRGPVGQRVIRTRYKIVTRRTGAGSTHNATLSPALTWRAKKLQSARSLLQSRMRPAPDRLPAPQPWRGRGMRWIGGDLYRVSANKLCRTTSTSSMGPAPSPRQRAGKWCGPPDGVGRAVCGWDPGRAVQRSLAIVRQARQKKLQVRQYCMYYNRFGKCNRGNACPYIHDPDKVAVCTRFLRGTCKQTDGSCPFSHKLSKEKMPVCSYFLRGVCSSSSCPYSHVYVSRSAAVCQDFLRGYCPRGEKCKQKHTLLCPDFSSTGSCPRGSKCKLQHRQRLKRAKSSQPPAPPKRARTEGAPPRPEGAEPAAEEPASSGREKLPSFISLPSSPEPAEEEEEADTPTAPGSEVTEKKLLIKPRF